jgi:hypothetical protein
VEATAWALTVGSGTVAFELALEFERRVGEHRMVPTFERKFYFLLNSPARTRRSIASIFSSRRACRG